MAKILIVEDENAVAENIKDCLTAERHTSERAEDGRVALELLNIFVYDLILVDWNMPNTSGVEVCQSFRANGGQTPIIMVTGNNKIKDVVAGLDAGADDYIIKPFDKIDLLGRIRAMLRRYPSTPGEIIELGPLRLDCGALEATYAGQVLKLRNREFSLLQFLAKHNNQHFSARDLINRVWAGDGEPSMEGVRQSVKRLRDALVAVGGKQLVRFDKNLGYTLSLEPDTAPA
jgi:DNA-binding response OmpR family regulator